MILIHLGLAKTGTSWLQKRVFPQLDVEYHHCGQYQALIYKPTMKKPMVLSYEGFSGIIPLNDRYTNAFRLKKMFPTARILLMIRDKEKYKNSLYSQHIKNGGVCSRQEFFDLVESHPYFLNWELYIRYLQKLWGERSVKVLSFDRMIQDYDGFLQELCDYIGVPVPVDIDYTPVNTSLSSRQVRIWRRWNHWFKGRWNTDAVLPKYLNPCFLYKNMEWYRE